MIAAVILAAGESSRMGRLKQLLPWAGTTLLDWQVREVRGAGVDDVVVVLGHAAAEIRDSLSQSRTEARIIVNQGFREGRASSLRVGAEAIPDAAEAVIVISVDQPRPAWLMQLLVARWRQSGAPVVMPRFDGHGGHPVLLAGGLLPALREVTEETFGLRAVIDANRASIGIVDLPASPIDVNLNTPAEYQAALTAYEAGKWTSPL